MKCYRCGLVSSFGVWLKDFFSNLCFFCDDCVKDVNSKVENCVDLEFMLFMKGGD